MAFFYSPPLCVPLAVSRCLSASLSLWVSLSVFFLSLSIPVLLSLSPSLPLFLSSSLLSPLSHSLSFSHTLSHTHPLSPPPLLPLSRLNHFIPPQVRRFSTGGDKCAVVNGTTVPFQTELRFFCDEAIEPPGASVTSVEKRER